MLVGLLERCGSVLLGPVSFLRTIVSSSRALVTGAKDIVRLREIARVFMRHGFGWAVGQLKIRRELQMEKELEGVNLTRAALISPETGKRLVAALTELGPTWVKFGQILSTRPDLFAPALIAELATLQDAVGPIPFEDVESQLKAELGDDYKSKFESIETESLASASIGQVHRAKLADGTEVVLKIQRPGIAPKIESDLHILKAAAGYVEDAFEEAQIMDLQGMVTDFAKSLAQELDYRSEANNAERFRRNFADNDKVYVPAFYEELCTSQVLCMEYVQGDKFDAVLERGDDTTPLVETYFDMAYKMLFVDGFFHGDLHPGNVFILDNERLALIDFGMVGRLVPSRKDKVVDIIWAVLNEDLEGLARVFWELSILTGPVDYPAFEADVISIAENYLVGVPLSQIEIGELFSEIVAGAKKHAVRMPTDFTMMFKSILTTEGLAKAIAPNVDPIALAEPYIRDMVTDRYSPERLKQVAFNDFQAISGLVRTLPRSVPTVLDALGKGDIKFGIPEATLVEHDRLAKGRLGRAIRASFSLMSLLCGTLALSAEGLPIAFWGLNWVTVALWAISILVGTTLLRRGWLK